MKKLTVTGLWAVLHGIQGSTMVGFTAETEPTMNMYGPKIGSIGGPTYKERNPFYGILIKRAELNGLVNFQYDEGVLRRIEKEGKSPDEFRRGESWHEPVLTPDGKLTPLCRHKKDQSYYLRFMLLKANEPTFLRKSNRAVVPTGDVKPWLPNRKPYENQGLDEPLKILTYSLNNIRSLKIKGEEYEII